MTYKVNNNREGKYADRKSLEKCRTVLHAGEESYTDEEVLLIRNFLIIIAELDYRQFQNSKNKKTYVPQKIIP